VRRILIIRLGALGDFCNSFPAFAALRAHHAGDRITLLTTAPFVSLALDSPWFDQVRVDERPAWLNLAGLWRLRRQLRGFDFIYDLQTSRRSSKYFWLAGRPPWSGIAAWCSHPDRNPARGALPTVARQRAQLAVAEVAPAVPDLSWLAERGPQIEQPYAMLAPGTSNAHGGAKQWPVERFAAVALHLADEGITPVIVGGAADRATAAKIRAACPQAIDLVGDTDLQGLAGLARRAAVAIGGDTGPIHLAGIMGCPTVALFSRFSDPANATPEGPCTVLRAERLGQISEDKVIEAIKQKPGETKPSPPAPPASLRTE
jgi:ADP-heptose:LPS heptosyltransferase